jgi:hypothetical protein
VAWETRSRHRFYYQSFRKNGRVARRYVGSASCPVTQIIAQADRLQGAERQAAADATRNERRAYEEAESLMRVVCVEGEALVRATLLREGFYQRGRGPWIKRKRQAKMTHASQCQASVPEPSQEEFCRLAAKADAGDPEALVKVQGILDRHPEIWRQVADLSGRTEAAFIHMISSRSATLAECLRHKVQEMKTDLETEHSTPLERSVIERVVICWLQVQFAEVGCAEHADDAEANYWQKRTDQAQRRYLANIKSLATIRKLLVPG